LEGCMLVSGRVGTEDMIFVDVVGVRRTSTGVVWREAQDIEVICYGDDWIAGCVMLIRRLGED
jgi:hypothetical protein